LRKTSAVAVAGTSWRRAVITDEDAGGIHGDPTTRIIAAETANLIFELERVLDPAMALSLDTDSRQP
jgi:hypothetical protein